MARLSATVNTLSQNMEQMSNRLAQAAGEIGQLQKTDSDLMQGAAEIAGRVVAVEDRVKTIGTTQANPGVQDPWAQARAGAGPAPAPAPQPTTTTAAQGLFGGQQGSGVGQPEIFEVGSVGRRERAPYNPNWKFDTKLSLDVKFHYMTIRTQQSG